MSDLFSHAMILAAGYATRLRPLSARIPKAALPVLGRPLVHHVLDWLSRFGAAQVAVNLHHLPERMREVVNSYDRPGFHITFSEETGEILRTAGALAPVRDLFRSGGTFLLVNGKIVTDIDLTAAFSFHRRSGNAATLVLVPNRTGEPFSHVEINPGGDILSYMSCAEAIEAGQQPLVFTGIHILEPEVLDFIPPNQSYDTVRDLYPDLARRGYAVRAFVADGDWFEFSTVDRYLRNSLTLLARRGLTRCFDGQGLIAPGTRLDRVIAGEDVAIGGCSTLTASILLGNNRVGREAELEECVLGPGAAAPDGARLKRRVVMAPPPLEGLAGGSDHLANGCDAYPF